MSNSLHPQRKRPACVSAGIVEGEDVVSASQMMIYVQRIEAAFTQTIAHMVPVEEIPHACRMYLDLRAKIDG